MGFGAIFSPGTAHKVDDTKAAINDTLAANSPYWQAGNLGPQAAILGQQAANAAATPFTVNTAAMDADAAKQAEIAAIYQNLFANGGMAEAAQTQAGNADIANSAQGGAAGIANQIAASRKVMGQTSVVGSQERSQTGGAANQNDYQVAMAKVQNALLKMQASHAAHQTALNAAAVQNYLGNQQIQNNQNLYDAASNARAGMSNTNQNMSNTQWNAGLQAGMSILGAGATGLGTAIDAFGRPVAVSNPLLSSQIDAANTLTLTSPSAQLKAATVGASPYTPGVLNSAYANVPNAWAIPSAAGLHP